jgi:predicted MFS family arabinose efflux permease
VSTVRLTVGQAIVRFLAEQYVERDGVQTRFIAGVWGIFGHGNVAGLGQAFGAPAYQALLPSLVKVEDLSNAIAMNSIQFNLARVIGPVLGGVALVKLGAVWCFGLNAASFLAVIAALVSVKAGFIPARTKDTLMTSMKQGLKFVRGHPAMPSLVALAFAMTMLGVPLVVFLPVIAKNVFHQGSGTYTLLLSIYGAGSIAGALAVASLGYVKAKGRIALVFLVCLGGSMSAFALSRELWLSCVFLFVSGACLVAVFSLFSSLVQEITGDHMRGRVMSVYNIALRGSMPVGSLVTGALVPYITAPVALALNGALLFGLAVYLIAVQKRVAEL